MDYTQRVIIDTDEYYPFHFESDHGWFAVQMKPEQLEQIRAAEKAFDEAQELIRRVITEQGGYDWRGRRTGNWRATGDTPNGD